MRFSGVVKCHGAHMLVTANTRRRRKWRRSPDARWNTYHEALLIASRLSCTILRMALAQKFSSRLAVELQAKTCHMLMSPSMYQFKLFVGVALIGAWNVEELHAGNHVYALLGWRSFSTLRHIILQIRKVGAVRQVSSRGITARWLHGRTSRSNFRSIWFIVLKSEFGLNLIDWSVVWWKLFCQKDSMLAAAITTLVRGEAAGRVLLLQQLL
mmetsp:Transcript_48319/g.67123  ORF Transcript_48319/g.67123 Transcript_48319/m.67123 type:complete len:212 (-) Transcript_48319:20-655(-)